MFDSSIWLRDIDNLTKSVVVDCAVTIQETLNRLARYDTSLRPQGSGKRVKDIFIKIKWLEEKERLAEFREKLKTGTERITMLLSVASKCGRNFLSYRCSLTNVIASSQGVCTA